MKIKQLTLTDIEHAGRKKTTRREEFLTSMDAIIPWETWIEIIRPHYPSGKRGRPVRGIETMLRMYLLQVWFTLSDVGVEDAIYDSYAMRTFMRIDFYNEQVPDATTLLKFRHLLEEHKIGEQIFEDLKNRLDEAGLLMHGGTIVDATIIHAPSSTKNAKGKRDEEMHQVKKGNQWYFGMKVHVGVDAGSGYVHTITGTAANEHDSQQISALIRRDDEVVYGDSGYLGAAEQEKIKTDEDFSKIEFRINKKPSSLKIKDCYKGENWDKKIERSKSSVRCKVEHPFLIVKRYFGYCKVVYKGIGKNMNRFNILFACANLVMCLRANRSLAPIGG